MAKTSSGLPRDHAGEGDAALDIEVDQIAVCGAPMTRPNTATPFGSSLPGTRQMSWSRMT